MDIKIIHTTLNVSSSPVLNNFLAIGFTFLERDLESPLSSHTRIKPSHTE